MNDQELSTLLQQAKAASPKPAPQLALRTMQAYREQFPKPSFLRRHWRLATAAAVFVAAVGILGTRSSTGSPLPPEYGSRHVLASGHMITHSGWKIEYSTALRPVVEGQFIAAVNRTSVTDPQKDVLVFRRYFGDIAANVWYGYEIVLHVDRASGRVTLQPLSERPGMTPREFAPAAAHPAASQLVTVQDLPAMAFETGQNIAVPVFTVPATGQKVIDYVNIDRAGLLDDLGDMFQGIFRGIHSHFMPHGPATTDRELHGR